MQRLIDEGRECRDVITQLVAASKAPDRAAFKILATGSAQCIADPGAQSDRDREDREKLCLTLAW